MDKMDRGEEAGGGEEEYCVSASQYRLEEAPWPPEGGRWRGWVAD